MRTLYSTCLKDREIQDLIQTESPEEFFEVLKETSYYQYAKNVEPRNILLFELSLNTYLHDLFNRLGRYSYDLYRIFSASENLISIKILSSLLQILARRDYDALRRAIEIAPIDLQKVFEEYLREEISLSKALEDLDRRGFGRISYYYKDISKIIPQEPAIVMASDLAGLELLAELLTDYPEISEMLCQEIELSILNLVSRVILRGLQERFGGFISRVISSYSCRLGIEVIEELLSSDETRLLSILRRVYPPQLISHDMYSTIINIRSYLRRSLRNRANSAFLSYPYSYSMSWAFTIVKRYDVEDLVSILSGKIGVIPSESIRKYISL